MSSAKEIRQHIPLSTTCCLNDDEHDDNDDIQNGGGVSSSSSLLPAQQQQQQWKHKKRSKKMSSSALSSSVKLSLFIFSLSSSQQQQHHTMTWASSPNIGGGGGSNFGVHHHHRRRQQLLQRKKPGVVPPYYSYFRGGQASQENNDGGDDDDDVYWVGGGGTTGGGESTLDDDGLDEYIEFLLAAAEDKASESDNPLFKKKQKSPSKKPPTNMLQSEERDEEIDDESVLLASTSTTTLMGNDDNLEKTEDEIVVPQSDTMNLEEEEGEDDEVVPSTIPQDVDIQLKEEDPVLLVDDVDDVSQLDTVIESLVASVGDVDDDLFEEEEEDEEEEETTVDAISATVEEVPAFGDDDDDDEVGTDKLVEEQLFAEKSETIEDFVPADEIEGEAIGYDYVEDTIQLDDEREEIDDASVEELVEVATGVVEEPVAAASDLEEETVFANVVDTIQLDEGPDSVAVEAAIEFEEEEEEQITVFDVDDTMDAVPDAVDEDLVESSTLQQIVDEETETLPLEEEQITIENTTPLVSVGLSGNNGEDVVVSEQLQDDVVVDDPEFFLGPSAAEDAPPIVVEAANSDSDDEESLSSPEMTASNEGEISSDDDQKVPETKKVSNFSSPWAKVKKRIVKSQANVNEKIKDFQESSTAAAKKQSKRLSESYSAFLSTSKSVSILDMIRMKRERKSTPKEDVIADTTNVERPVVRVDHDRIYKKYFGDESQHSPLDDLHSGAHREKESDQQIPAHKLKSLQSRISTVVLGYPAEGLRTLMNAGRSTGERAGQAVHDIAIKYPSEGIRTIVDTGRNPRDGFQALVNTGRAAGIATGLAAHDVAVKYPSKGIRTVFETSRTTGETAGQALHDIALKYPSKGIRAIILAGQKTSASTSQTIDAFISKQVAFFRKKRGTPETTMLSDTDTDATLVEVDIEDVAVESDLELSSSEDEEILMGNSGDEGEGLLDASVADEEDDSIMLESSSEEEEEQLSDAQSEEEIEIGLVDDSMSLDEEMFSHEADVVDDVALEDTYIEEEHVVGDSHSFVDAIPDDVDFVPDEAEMPGGDFKVDNTEDHDVETLGDYIDEVAAEDTELSQSSDEDHVKAADEDIVYEGLDEAEFESAWHDVEVEDTEAVADNGKKDDDLAADSASAGLYDDQLESNAGLDVEAGSFNSSDLIEDDLPDDQIEVQGDEMDEAEKDTDNIFGAATGNDISFDAKADSIVVEEEDDDVEEDLDEFEVTSLAVEEEEEETEYGLDADIELEDHKLESAEKFEFEYGLGAEVNVGGAAASASEDDESEDARDADQESPTLEVAEDEYDEFSSADDDVGSMADQAEELTMVCDDEVSAVDEEEEGDDIELESVGVHDDYDSEVEDGDQEGGALLVGDTDDDTAVEDSLITVDALDAEDADNEDTDFEDIDEEEIDMLEDVEHSDIEYDAGNEQKVNFFYRFLLARGLRPLVMIFVVIVEWCRVYLSPFLDDISELPGWLLRKESHDTLAFLRGGAMSNSAPVKTLPGKATRSGNATKIIDDKGDEEESESGDRSSTASESAKKDMGKGTPRDIFPVSNKRPNGIYRFLLRYGVVGHVVAMEMILFREWIHTFIPILDSLLSTIGDAIFPGSSRALRDHEDGMVSQTTGFVSSDGSAARGGKKRRSQTKKDDQKAISQMQQLGDVSMARYRFLSESFMKRHCLGDYRSDAVEEVPRTQVGRKSREIVVEEDIEESDAGWVLDALTQEEESPVGTSMDVALGSDGASVSVGVEFNFGNTKTNKKRKKRPSLSEIAMDKPADKVKNVGPRVSDRDSGVMGRLRAAGANSLVGRSLLGAYPGDAPPPHEAASHLGLLEMAYKYGYGDLTDDEYEDDTVQLARRSTRRSRKPSSSSSSRRKKRRKDTTASIGLEFDFRSGIEDPFPSTESNSPIISASSAIGDAPSLTSILGEVEKSSYTRETPSTRKKRRRTTVRPAMEALNEANGISESRVGRSGRPKKTKRRHKGDSITTKSERTVEGSTSEESTTKVEHARGSQLSEVGSRKKPKNRVIRPAMDVLKEKKETKKSSGEDKVISLKKKRKRKVVKPAMSQLKDVEKGQAKDTEE